jgi:hypothetical protein
MLIFLMSFFWTQLLNPGYKQNGSFWKLIIDLRMKFGALHFYLYLVALGFSMRKSQKIGHKKVFLNVKRRDAFDAFY